MDNDTQPKIGIDCNSKRHGSENIRSDRESGHPMIIHSMAHGEVIIGPDPVFASVCGGELLTDGGEDIDKLEVTDLTAFQQFLLTILAGGPKYGLAIKRRLEARSGQEVNHGRLYPNLDRLVDAGYVDKSERDKRTNEYELTSEGRKVLCENLGWLAGQLGFDVVEAAEDDGGDDRVLIPNGGTVEHVPHSSADYDDMDYVDDRGIRVFDREWTCPNCGDDGELMFRPGSKNTCARCFWVINGQYNDYVLSDFPLKYRHAQRLLASMGEKWHGTPGDIGTRLRQFFDSPQEAEQAWRKGLNGELVTDGGDVPSHEEVAAEKGDKAERLDGEFTSGAEHILYDEHKREPEPSWEDMCTVCGDEAYNHMCGSCGRPLCGMHHELGAGFCSDFEERDGKPGCEFADEFHVADHMMEESR